jgi:osmotically-inducible protein OsmY
VECSAERIRSISCSGEKPTVSKGEYGNIPPYMSLLTVVFAGTLAGCSTTSTKAPDVSGSIRASLDQAGFKDVTENQDREKGVVTLGGHVPADRDKVRAEYLATSMAGAQVVANQIAVIPAGAETEAKAVNSDLDRGIENNLDAALRQNACMKASNTAWKTPSSRSPAK